MKYNVLIAQALFAVVLIAASTKSAYTALSQPGMASSTQKATVRSPTSISGSVVNDSGRPMQYARVSVTGYGRQPVRQTVTTDEAGHFLVDSLPRGLYFVVAQAPGYVLSRDAGEPAQHKPGDSVNLVLRKGAAITGTVTNSEGDPVVGVQVGATLLRDERGRIAGTTYGSRVSDDRGVYRIFGLPAGTYVVSAAPKVGASQMPSAYSDDAPTYYPSSTRDTAAELSLQYGAEATGIDIRYRGERGHAISGSLSESFSATFSAPGVSVLLMRASNDAMEGQTFVQPSGQRGFGFYGVSDGDYYLTARRGSFQSDDGAASKRVPVKVRGHDVTGVVISLLPMGSIAGRMALDPTTRSAKCETAAPPAIQESLITISSDDSVGDDASSKFASSLYAPETNGDFVFQGLPAARYRLDSRRVLDEAWYIRAFTAPGPGNAPVDASRNGLSLKAGQRISGVRIVLGEGAASIRGKVVAEKGGVSLPDRLRVHLVPAESEAANDTLRYYEVEAQNGGFKLANLAPGRYWMIAKALPEEKANDRIPRPLAWNAANRAALRREAETVNNALELKPCQRIANHLLRYVETQHAPATRPR